MRKLFNELLKLMFFVGRYGLLVLVLNVGCSDKLKISQQTNSQSFTQNLNPEYLDILWMIDNRSPMYFAKDHVIAEAEEFFLRLENITVDYRMGITNADASLNPGLFPKNSPFILQKNMGTLAQRVDFFSNMLNSIVNLSVSGDNKGFESTRKILTSSFVPRPGVKLVLVMISFGDESFGFSPQSVSYYKDAYVNAVGGDENLLNIHAVNYRPGVPTDQNRCAQRYNANIDMFGFQDRYFQMANSISNGSTADLCGDFSSQIDLSGVILNILKTRFRLNSAPNNPSEIVVNIVENGVTTPTTNYTYDSSTQEIVFNTAPPAGSTVVVNY